MLFVRDMPSHGRSVAIHLDVPRFKCHGCVKTFTAVVPEVDADRPTWLDPYAAQGPEEFFPVAAEAFFVAPHGLALEFPEVYALMRDFFHQDPRLHAR